VPSLRGPRLRGRSWDAQILPKAKEDAIRAALSQPGGVPECARSPLGSGSTPRPSSASAG
jgi:hypothetical protein